LPNPVHVHRHPLRQRDLHPAPHADVAPGPRAPRTWAGLSYDRLDGIAATACGLLLDAWKGFAFVVNCTQAKEFTLAHCW
jgi:hypothetical protein